MPGSPTTPSSARRSWHTWSGVHGWRCTTHSPEPRSWRTRLSRSGAGARRRRGSLRGSSAFVQRDGFLDEPLERLLVDLLALLEVDRTPRVDLQAGVEETRRVLQRRALGEGRLHDALVGLAGADDAAVRPHRDPAPFPVLDRRGVGLFDQRADLGERLATPVAELGDPRVDELRRGVCVVHACALLVLVGGCSEYSR